MSAAPETRPVYRTADWAPVQVFDCPDLRATLTVPGCASNWARATASTASCYRCEIGEVHHKVHHGAKATAATASKRKQPQCCLRCGRVGSRLIYGSLCVSCTNRMLEWRRGRNSKGNAPATFVPLQRRVVAIEQEDGRVEWHWIEARDMAETLGEIARHRLGYGRFTDAQPGVPTWSLDRGRFEYLDPGTGRILLERMTGSGVIKFAPEDGELGGAWMVAIPRQPVSILNPGDAAALLDVMASDELAVLWTSTAHVCGACRKSPLEARRQADSVPWEVRCPACGANHKHDAVAG